MRAVAGRMARWTIRIADIDKLDWANYLCAVQEAAFLPTGRGVKPVSGPENAGRLLFGSVSVHPSYAPLVSVVGCFGCGLAGG